jgi:hypothetical protein
MHTCCCAVRVTTWFPEANEEAAIWAGPVIVTMLNGMYHKTENMRHMSSTEHKHNHIFCFQITD